MHMQELIEQLGQNQAQWLDGSTAFVSTTTLKEKT
jgi:hypothetical protein